MKDPEKTEKTVWKATPAPCKAELAVGDIKHDRNRFLLTSPTAGGRSLLASEYDCRHCVDDDVKLNYMEVALEHCLPQGKSHAPIFHLIAQRGCPVCDAGMAPTTVVHVGAAHVRCRDC